MPIIRKTVTRQEKSSKIVKVPICARNSPRIALKVFGDSQCQKLFQSDSRHLVDAKKPLSLQARGAECSLCRFLGTCHDKRTLFRPCLLFRLASHGEHCPARFFGQCQRQTFYPILTRYR
jgi:hypothetical protein